MATKRKRLTLEEVKMILSLDKKTIDAKLLRSLFAAKLGQAEPRFNTYDIFTLPKGAMFNDHNVETTIGRYIFNKFCLEENFLRKFGYQNMPITKDAMAGIEDKYTDSEFNY